MDTMADQKQLQDYAGMEYESSSCSDDSFMDDSWSVESDESDEDMEDETQPLSSAAVIKLLRSNEETELELELPIPDDSDFQTILQGLRHNTSLIECSVSTLCFSSLSPGQRKELVFALFDLPTLKSLTLDAIFPEVLCIQDQLRCFKRNMHYQQHQTYASFENRTIKELHIIDIPSDTDGNLFVHLINTTVSNFASLQHLNLIFAGEFASPQAVLTRAALTALNHSSSLKTVRVGYMADGEHNLMFEVDVSRSNGILRVLKLRCGGEDSLSEHSYMELSQMLRTNSRTLRGLVLDTAVDNNGALTIANTLGQSSNLKALCLGTFDCQDKMKRFGLMSLLSQVLCPSLYSREEANRSSLEYLSLVCQEMDDEGVAEISKTLSQSQLKELMLFVDNETNETMTSQGIAALADVLCQNNTIGEFNLICHSLNDNGVMAFAKALKANSCSLKTLKLRCSKAFQVTGIGYKAVVDMLKTNTTLESFELCGCPGSEEDDDFVESDLSKTANLQHTPAIDFYLSLNKAGIRSLQLDTNVTPAQFRSAIVSHRDDLSKVFYMLSSNPSFVAFGV